MAATPQTTIDLDRVTLWPAWLARVGLSERTGERMLKAKTHPRLTQLTARRFGVRERDHIAWLDARAKAEDQAA
jgi:predicted DNA-binding transcriptional regulator AlpA